MVWKKDVSPETDLENIRGQTAVIMLSESPSTLATKS